jgi:hypothetical protein
MTGERAHDQTFTLLPHPQSYRQIIRNACRGLYFVSELPDFEADNNKEQIFAHSLPVLLFFPQHTPHRKNHPTMSSTTPSTSSHTHEGIVTRSMKRRLDADIESSTEERDRKRSRLETPVVPIPKRKTRYTTKVGSQTNGDLSHPSQPRSGETR